MSTENDNKPILYPLKRILYSRKVLVAVVAVLVATLGEYGLSVDIIEAVRELAIAIIIGWTAKDVATNLVNGKK